MGAIGGLFGLNGGVNGTGISGPGLAPIANPTNAGQTSTAYSGNQAALTQQQNLLSALQGQNGLGNQSQNYNQLQGIVNGTGPNPAQAQLAQSTGQNVANQASLAAGQRGASSNVGLLSRQAAMQGANMQQQAAGQAATLQAQQSLNALGQAGNIANTQAGQQIAGTSANTQAQQAEQGQLLGAQAAFNNAQVGGQSSVNAANAALANTQMQGQQNTVGGTLTGSNVLSALAQGGRVGYDDGGFVADTQQDSAGTAPPPAEDTSLESSPTEANAAATGAVAGSSGQPGPQSGFGKFLSSMKAGKGLLPSIIGGVASSFAPADVSGGPGPSVAPVTTTPNAGGGKTKSGGGGGVGSLLALLAEGGTVNAMVSPGEKYLPPSKVNQVKQGANPMAVGETIPGKPKVGGAVNSYQNDTVPRTLEEGGIVIPRSITQGKDAVRKSAEFVRKTLAKGKK